MTTPNPYGALIDIVVAVSAVLFFVSLLYAYRLRQAAGSGAVASSKLQTRGYLLIGLWVILPPIWFFLEFQLLHPNMVDNSFELSRVKQAQDLARNVWLAFVVVLAAILGVKWPPGN